MGQTQQLADRQFAFRVCKTKICGRKFNPAYLLLAAMLFFGSLCFAAPGRGQTAHDGSEALRASAAAARDRGDIPLAIQLYRQALSEDPRWSDGWWFLGNLEYRLDQYQQASTSLGHYIELVPTSPAAFALRGLSEFETTAYAESLQDIQHALALGAANQPKNGQILLYHEALLLTRLGRFEEAIAKYTLFVKQGIINRDVETGFGLAGLRIAALPREIDPNDAQLVSMTGHAAVTVLTAESTAGRQEFQTVLAAFPGRPYVHYFCGYLLFTTNPDQAMEEFKLELAVSPASALAHSMLAWASEFRGDYAEALPYARAAVAEDPNLLMSQLVLGRAMVETKDLSGSMTHLDQVVQADPANLEAHLSLAKVYSKLGRKDDARRERLLCLELSGQQSGGGKAADANR